MSCCSRRQSSSQKIMYSNFATLLRMARKGMGNCPHKKWMSWLAIDDALEDVILLMPMAMSRNSLGKVPS